MQLSKQAIENCHHKEYASGKWFELSLCEQLGNVGSEIERIVRWKNKGNDDYAAKAFFRALELLDLTRADSRWQNCRLKELGRIRECLCHAFYDEPIYDVDLDYLQKYFFDFALVARATYDR